MASTLAAIGNGLQPTTSSDGLYMNMSENEGCKGLL